jgi:hypothetical protein
LPDLTQSGAPAAAPPSPQSGGPADPSTLAPSALGDAKAKKGWFSKLFGGGE